ncbi:MAG: hypothetical protein JO323_13305 [Acidobacteriia bacterium]|nr:hypothetical protein [Terriglobia bacterium]
MSRSTLKILAVVLTCLIIVIAFNAFDHLPGSVRAQIDSERAALSSAQKQLAAAQADVNRELQSHAVLFRSIPAARQWPARFTQASGVLRSASGDLEQLTELQKHGHFQDRQRAESLVAQERNLRSNAAAQIAAIKSEASQLVNRSEHLPGEVRQMEQNYQAIHAFDLGGLKASVARAESDWPEKRSDLESRLASVTGVISEGDSVWQATAKARSEAANPPADFDAGAFLASSDTLRADATALPQKAAALQSLTGQLYNSWDKILVDMETRGRGSDRTWDQKVRTVTTHYSDASAKNGATNSEEKWVQVSQATYDEYRKDLGMDIEHKPAGKYDYEAEHAVQPPGFAYIASPSQGSNQYGYWDHRGGESFWVFYGQYALMRDLLFNHSYIPVPRYDWEGYRTYHDRGQTYYGRDFGSDAPKYGTNGTSTQDRYAGSNFGKSGGFKGSQYASRSGSYRNSPYASPSARNPGADSDGRVFGRNHEEPRVSPPHNYRPRPTPSFRPPSGGRRFGGRR